MSLRRICVFCGSQAGTGDSYVAAARSLGRTLTERGLAVVYGGGNVGLMGELADAALAAGGDVIGVIPEALVRKEVAHTGLSELHVVGSMHERKARMADLSDAFIALPGGMGTFEELFEILTWTQLGLHGKPCALLDVDGYFAPLLELLDHAVSEGFVQRRHRALLLHSTSADELLAAFAHHRAAATEPLIDRETS